jgi:hypothetical protein
LSGYSDIHFWFQFEEVCPAHCPCEFPNWRSQTISLDALKEVEFNGFDGADHAFDLLKLILGCAPTLKRMIVKLSEETSASDDGCKKIYNIFKVCSSSVECDVYHSSGEYIFGMHYYYLPNETHIYSLRF